MTISIEAIGGGAAINLAKVRRLIQDAAQRDVVAANLGVSPAEFLAFLLTEETRIAALT
jgi:hypothetical protein